MTLKMHATMLWALLAISSAQAATAGDVTGTWLMAVQTGVGSGTPTFVLVQKGDAITGSYKGRLGEAPVTGSVSGNSVTLKYQIDAQGQSLNVTYNGILEGASMSGTVELGSLGQGTFKGTKQ